MSPNCRRHSALYMKASHNPRFAAAAIALGATVAVTLQDGIEECCTSAHAQTQTASPDLTIWDHNGSVMYLVENGSSREFHYQKPRPGMLEAGARPGSLLFRGQVDNGQYTGTAYIFNPHCGAISFQVKGPVLDNDERIMLTGQAPQAGRNCRTYGSFTSNLEFRRLKPTEAAQSQEPLVEATQALGVEQSRSEAPSGEAENSPSDVTVPKVSPSTPIARLPVTNGARAAKDLDNYIWAAVLIAVILVVSAAAMLAAA
jgi:hypothetical protein